MVVEVVVEMMVIVMMCILQRWGFTDNKVHHFVIQNYKFICILLFVYSYCEVVRFLFIYCMSVNLLGAPSFKQERWSISENKWFYNIATKIEFRCTHSWYILNFTYM